MAMRTNATWPTVFYSGSQSVQGLGQQVVASSLTPVGWLPSGLGTYQMPETWLRTATGHDGRVGAAMLMGNSVRFTQSSVMGWQSSTAGTVYSPGPQTAPDVDYLSGNRPVVAYAEGSGGALRVAAYDGLTWNTDTVTYQGSGPVPQYGDHVSMAVDSQDRIGVAYAAGPQAAFAFKNQLAGTWMGSSVGMIGSIDHMSLAFGPNDEPGLAILTGNGDLKYAAFDIQSGSWQTETIASAVRSDRVNLAFDGQGHPALAYVAQNGGNDALFYSANLGGGWVNYMLPSGQDPGTGLFISPSSYSEAALAFDSANTPLIAYYSANADILLAYDPPVPEPASALLMAAAGIVSWRRWRSA
jgi:hypothetical protein